MSKVRTFSRVFPKGHPKQGQPTYFVEKIWESLYPEIVGWEGFAALKENGFDIGLNNIYRPKHHTIRSGKHFKAGDYFSPRIWSGQPYASKQIIIAPDIQVKKVWDFETYGLTTLLNNRPINHLQWAEVAENDGLSATDLHDWLKPPFVGQIICWNENVNY